MKKIQSLNGTWNMRECGKKEAFPASIPGSVIACLLENKQIQDPYYRDNEYEVRDLFWKDYEFERELLVAGEFLKEDVVELVCYGLDTLCDIYLNENLLASTNNMHRTWRFPVKEYLKEGSNNLKIVCKSSLEYMKNYQPAPNKEITFVSDGTSLGGQYLRKAHSMFGWDWGPKLPDAGIFRDINLEAYCVGKLEDAVITQIHSGNENSGALVKLIIEPHIRKIVNGNYTIAAKVKFQERDIDSAMAEERLELNITEAQLWWPNGYGEQPLYQVEIILFYEDKIIDTLEYTIGLRTLTISQEKDQWGTEFAFMVNGVKIFTKGANYIPEDCIYSRITREKMEYLVKSSVRAHFNCLRIWGGGYYPSDTFYDLCDRYGLIVWQDLMYACNIYDVTKEFEENIIEETKDNITRLRHHACLGLWCGNNEIESAWHHWDGFQKHSTYLKADYIKQFEYILPKATAEADSQTCFWPSSPSSGGCFDAPDSENFGDTHYWDVWHGLKPFSDYRKHYFRFCSEFGFQSFPSIKTINTFTLEEDRNIFSKVMESHQKNNAANGKILYYISENFKYPKDFESLLYVSQVLQAVAIKSGVEHWRRNRGRCMGTIYWQLNDNWPVASWSSIDYFGRYKALHYMAMNFYEQEAGSTLLQENTVEAHIQNENLTAGKCKVTMNLRTLDFTIMDSISTKLELEPLSAKKVMEKDYSEFFLKNPKENLFLETCFEYENGRIQKETEVFVPYKHLNLSRPEIALAISETEECYKIQLTAASFAPFIQLDFKEEDVIFSDNFFSITSKEEKTVIINKEDIRNGNFRDGKDLLEKLQILSLWDSF